MLAQTLKEGPQSEQLSSYEYLETELNGVPVGIEVKVSELQALPAGPVGSSVPPASPPGPTDISPVRGWPVEGRITQSFGCVPYNTGVFGPDCQAGQPWFHDGIDIAARAGRPVKAMMNGIVIFAGPDGQGPACGQYRGFGLGVVLDNQAGWQTMYAHLSEIEVLAGQAVTSETIIGVVGQTGCVTGPHLHFGLRHNGELVNPEQRLGRR